KEAVRLASLNITSITVEPADGIIKTTYSYQFSAIGHHPDGSTTNITNSVAWSSSNDAIATVDSNGKVITVADGDVSITASLSSLDGSTSLTASSDPLDSIAIFADSNTPNDLSVSACKNIQLKAIGTYNGVARDTIPITDNVSWSDLSGSDGFSTDTKGLLHTKTDGTIAVRASLDGIDSPDTNVTAADDLTSVAVTPENATLAVNAKLPYVATGTYADNSTEEITDNITWTSSESTIADFNTPVPNEITGLSIGTTTITAACGTDPDTGTTNLTVNEEVVAYVQFEDTNGSEINPLNTVVGVTTQVVLKEYLTDGSSREVTENAQWTIFNNTDNIVSVDNTTDNKGKVTALDVGTGLVQASYKQIDYLLVVNVSQP
ncbi:Ig-like domain-containing protein, partial [Kaarinaea lacus]